jgi:hypothetical protein
MLGDWQGHMTSSKVARLGGLPDRDLAFTKQH